VLPGGLILHRPAAGALRPRPRPARRRVPRAGYGGIPFPAWRSRAVGPGERPVCGGHLSGNRQDAGPHGVSTPCPVTARGVL